MKSIFLFLFLATPLIALDVQLSGFGTVGVTGSDTTIPYDNFVTQKATTAYDSITGLNISLGLNDDWEIYAQFVSKYNLMKEEYELQLDWAQATYVSSEYFKLSIGKQKFNAWLTSDYLNIAYLYPSVRQPLEVYSLALLSNFVGVSFSVPFHYGEEYTGNLDLYVGQAPFHLMSYSKSAGETLEHIGKPAKIMGATLKQLYKNFTFQYGFMYAGHGRGTLKLDQKTPPPTSPTPTQHTLITSQVDVSYTLHTLGIKADFEHLFFMSEFATSKMKNIWGTKDDFLKSNGLYTTLGLNIDLFSPYITYATINKFVNSSAGYYENDQTSYMAGLKYTVNDFSCLKFEYQQTKADKENGFFSSPTNMNRKVNFYTMTLDFIF